MRPCMISRCVLVVVVATQLDVASCKGAKKGKGKAKPTISPEQKKQKEEQLNTARKRFSDLHRQWTQEGELENPRKEVLAEAFEAITPLMEFLDKDASGRWDEMIPDWFSLALQVLESRQTKSHTAMALPVILSAMDNFKPDKQRPLRDLCAEQEAKHLRSPCQDIYAIHCYLLAELGQESEEGDDEEEPLKFTPEDYLSASESCVEEYNANLDEQLQFSDAEHSNRQLPIIKAQPWHKMEESSFASLSRIFAQHEAIAKEVMEVVASDTFDAWKPVDLKQGRLYIQNDEWDITKGWDRLDLYANNGYQAKCDKLFPTLCGILRSEDAELKMLLDPMRQNELVSKDVREGMRYGDKPDIGIKLDRLWPENRIKAHASAPGRLVHALAINAPEGSTVTVAGEERAWQKGAAHVYDDSFFNSMKNPHPSEYRIVLTINTWHPDLKPLAQKDSDEL